MGGLPQRPRPTCTNLRWGERADTRIDTWWPVPADVGSVRVAVESRVGGQVGPPLSTQARGHAGTQVRLRWCRARGHRVRWSMPCSLARILPSSSIAPLMSSTVTCGVAPASELPVRPRFWAFSRMRKAISPATASHKSRSLELSLGHRARAHNTRGSRLQATRHAQLLRLRPQPARAKSQSEHTGATGNIEVPRSRTG